MRENIPKVTVVKINYLLFKRFKFFWDCVRGMENFPLLVVLRKISGSSRQTHNPLCIKVYLPDNPAPRSRA